MDNISLEELALRCHSCGRVLNPPYDKIYTRGKQKICEECYNASKGVKKSSQNETDENKILLYEKIRKVYNFDTIPAYFIAQIDKTLHDDSHKNYGSLYYTLYYAVDIEGFNPSPEYGITGIITMFYDKAKAYYEKINEVTEYNSKVKLENRKVSVTIDNRRPLLFTPKTNIESLGEES